MAEIWQLYDHKRQVPRHIIVIQIKNLQIVEQGELQGQCTINEIVREVKVFKRRDGRDLRRNGAGNLIGREGEIREKPERTQVRRESTREIQSCKVEADDVATEIAGDSGPSTVGSGGVPSGERRLGVIGKRALEREKSAIFRQVRRKGEMKMEVKKEKEKEKKLHFNGEFQFLCEQRI